MHCDSAPTDVPCQAHATPCCVDCMLCRMPYVAHVSSPLLNLPLAPMLTCVSATAAAHLAHNARTGPHCGCWGGGDFGGDTPQDHCGRQAQWLWSGRPEPVPALGAAPPCVPCRQPSLPSWLPRLHACPVPAPRCPVPVPSPPWRCACTPLHSRCDESCSSPRSQSLTFLSTVGAGVVFSIFSPLSLFKELVGPAIFSNCCQCVYSCLPSPATVYHGTVLVAAVVGGVETTC